jgi:hypothetical protein
MKKRPGLRRARDHEHSFSLLDSAGRKPGGGAMRCFLLQGKYMIYCTAVKEGYIPSTAELDEYCRQERHKMCPLYCKAELSGKFDFSAAEEKR